MVVLLNLTAVSCALGSLTPTEVCVDPIVLHSKSSLLTVTISGKNNQNPLSLFILHTTGELSEPITVLWGFKISEIFT